MTENEMAGWHHQLNGHEFEQALGVGDGQGSLACCSPWGCKVSDMSERLNNNNNIRSRLPAPYEAEDVLSVCSMCVAMCSMCVTQKL